MSALVATLPRSRKLGVEVVRADVRNNARVMIDDPEMAEMLGGRIKPEAPAFLNGRQAIGLNERLRFYRYDPGQHSQHTWMGVLPERTANAVL